MYVCVCDVQPLLRRCSIEMYKRFLSAFAGKGARVFSMLPAGYAEKRKGAQEDRHQLFESVEATASGHRIYSQRCAA